MEKWAADEQKRHSLARRSLSVSADTGRRRSSAASHGALQLGRPKGTYEGLLWLEGLVRTRTFEHLRSVRLASIVCLVLVETGFVR